MRKAKLSFVETMASKYDVIAVQEAHDDGECGRHLQQLLRQSHTCFWNPLDASGRAGGTAMLGKRHLLQFFDEVECHNVVPGRYQLLSAEGRLGCLQVVNVHLEPAASECDHHRHLEQLRARCYGPCEAAVYILGDFNFETCAGDRVNMLTGQPCGTPGRLAELWDNSFGGYAELHQPDPSRAPRPGGSVSTASRIDRVHSSLQSSVLCDFAIDVRTVGAAFQSFTRLSDHVAVTCTIAVRRKRPSQFGKPVAQWICKHLAFQAHLEVVPHQGLCRLPVCGVAAVQEHVSRSCRPCS